MQCPDCGCNTWSKLGYNREHDTTIISGMLTRVPNNISWIDITCVRCGYKEIIEIDNRYNNSTDRYRQENSIEDSSNHTEDKFLRINMDIHLDSRNGSLHIQMNPKTGKMIQSYINRKKEKPEKIIIVLSNKVKEKLYMIPVEFEKEK